ncbi:hypothetical protein SUNI508_07329 [Seiridium unicorne]|uniref:Uncharacterized protein n=1 Tax=Seiridium unicorne TaxID=138068 RepID=A0ABR2UYU3_9PEZI
MTVVLLAFAFTVVLVGLRFLVRISQKNTGRVPKVRENQRQDAGYVQVLKGFNWSEAEPLKFRNFKPVYFITMGVRSADPSELITIDQNYLARIQTRQQTMQDHAGKVLGCLPSGAAAVQEIYTYLLTDYLPSRYPSMFVKDEKKFLNLVTNVSLPLQPPSDPIEALKLLGETVEDDMFLLQQEPEGHRSIAALCTSPSGFDPSEKLGKLLKDIHTPVPAYDKIGPSMERYFSRVAVGKNAVRTNWSITASPALLNLATNHVKDGDVVEEDIQVDISQARLRVELQTLSRLPKTRALLFSFKTYIYPLEDIKSEGLGSRLADAIEGLDTGNADGMWTYKGGVRWGKSVCIYLRSQTTPSGFN